MRPISFDDVPKILKQIADTLSTRLDTFGSIVAIRDLWGRVRFVVLQQRPMPNTSPAEALEQLAHMASERLGARAYPPSEAILYADEILTDMDHMASEPSLPIHSETPELGKPVFRLIDRQITGQSWSTVSEPTSTERACRVALYSLKGGVGRSTATATVAWHLARQGRSVLVLDLDLESPGLSTSLLTAEHQPDFGIVDWFVEDAVGQGKEVIGGMRAQSPLALDLPGEIWVVPSHGAQPGDFIAKLGRCYLDMPSQEGRTPWGARLAHLLEALEADKKPDVILLDARAGLHDLASVTVTELADITLLFAVGSAQTWNGYRLLFEHWNRFGVAETIRRRLQLVAALIPETDRASYLADFMESAWGLFSEHLYDEMAPGAVDGFNFDLNDDPAPHRALPIYWNRGLATPSRLVALDPQLVDATAGRFLRGMDELLASTEGKR